MKSHRALLILLGAALGIAGASPAMFSQISQKLLFHPSHNFTRFSDADWIVGGNYIGQCFRKGITSVIWLMLPGNAGQAADRSYASGKIPQNDGFYVLEYPGFGPRSGVPSSVAINRAAKDAYEILMQQNPSQQICVLGESIGSGPACYLCSLPNPPRRLVLMAPFDRLDLVAADHFPKLLVKFLLSDNWDNLKALKSYQCPIAIFASTDDAVIPAYHAQALAASKPQATMTYFLGGHNAWAASQSVAINQ
jgi:hypothetical protein